MCASFNPSQAERTENFEKDDLKTCRCIQPYKYLKYRRRLVMTSKSQVTELDYTYKNIKKSLDIRKTSS